MENTSYANPYGQQMIYQRPQPYVQNGAPYPQQLNQPVNIPPRIVDFVQGELAATIYPVAYGQEVSLIDMDNPNRMYRKSRDGNGILSPLQKFNLVAEVETKSEPVDLKEYVKVDDILDIVSEAVQNEVEKRLSQISFKPAPSQKKGSEE